MSQTSVDRIAEDLAYVRGVAEEGRRAPLLGGRFFVLWGLLVAAGSIGHWMIAVRIVAAPLWAIAFQWLAVMAVGTLACGFMGRNVSLKPGANSIGNKVEQAVWSAAGAFFMVLAFSMMGFALLGGGFVGAGAEEGGRLTGWVLFAIFPSIMFGVYAIALSATASAAQIDMLKPFVGLSYGFVIATALLANSSLQYFVTAVGILVVSVGPGLLLMRDEPPKAA